VQPLPPEAMLKKIGNPLINPWGVASFCPQQQQLEFI